MKGIAYLAVLLSLPSILYGWENEKTHPAITNNSVTASIADNYFKTQTGLTNGITTQLYWNFPQDIKTRISRGKADSNQTTRSILEWLRVGSIIEDTDESTDLRRAVAPWRPRHHFHDPYRNAGLDNHTDHPNWKAPFGSSWLPLGQSAMDWAILGAALQEPFTNNEKWEAARLTFYESLTDPNKNMREAYLAESFLKLGCVLHMIEDMGVPAHTRNDFLFAHYRVPKGMWGNPLESYVEDEIEESSGIPARWLTGWTPQPQVFDKVSSYWDINGYTGQDVGTSPLSNWGLSECTNYQFLSYSTIFRADDGTKYYFPHPDPCNTSPHIDSSWWYKRRYKSGYGITHLARTNFTEKYVVAKYDPNRAYGPASHWPYRTEAVPYDTTFDKAVYEDYAEITIPRTIDYATGLVNYFFRGRLSVEPNFTDPNIAEFVITNDSNNSGIPQTLKGGMFEIYWDDVNDTRTKIDPNNIIFTPEWTPAATLPNDGGTTNLIVQFTMPTQQVKKYIVVYKGNICENPANPDADDANAIAVWLSPPGFEVFAWGDDDDGQVSDVPAGSDFIAVAAGKYHCLALKSDGTICAWGWDDYGQVSNIPDGNDIYIAIAAGNRHSIALKSDGSIVVWGDDGLNQITNKPAGNDFIAITAGDYHSLALKSDGTIVGWGGWNSFGECDAPAPDAGTVYTAIAAGKYHSLALQSDGIPKAWGSNNQGQTRFYTGISGIAQVAACDYYSMVLRDDQWITTWGNSDWVTPNVLPRYHHRPADSNDFIVVAAGWDHILALTSDGKVFAWDWPMGDYPFEIFSRTVPQGVIFTEDISAGYDFSLALKVP